MSFEILELLNEINKMGTTILMVTHEVNLARHFKKRVVEINKGTIKPIELKVIWRLTFFYENAFCCVLI